MIGNTHESLVIAATDGSLLILRHQMVGTVTEMQLRGLVTLNGTC